MLLQLGPNVERLRFEVRTTRTHLSYPLATGLIEEARGASERQLLFAPYVPAGIGHHLAEQGLSYVDAVGNCHIESDRVLVAHVEGKKAVRQAGSRTPRASSHQLLFALLAQPDLAEAPVRKVAHAAGVGKSSALEHLGRLHAEGMLDYHPSLGLLRKRELLQRWLTAYTNSVRPSWLVGRYRAQVTEPAALATLIDEVGGDCTWAFGGMAAASRLVQMDRGTEIVLHVAEDPVHLLEKLRAVSAVDGPLIVFRTPGALAYAGPETHLAHPLLVYTELLSSTEPAAVWAANAVREQFMTEQTSIT